MKQKRHNTILSLINSKIIETQSELTEELEKLGFQVTQATVSRDIKDLNLMKCQVGDGRYRYAQQGAGGNITGGTGRIKTIFANSVIGIDYSLNQIVVKTLSGMAQAAAITIEGMGHSEILGTIAGDDTVLVVARGEREAADLTKILTAMIDN